MPLYGIVHSAVLFHTANKLKTLRIPPKRRTKLHSFGLLQAMGGYGYVYYVGWELSHCINLMYRGKYSVKKKKVLNSIGAEQ